MIEIYTDGSCWPNPSAFGGWAFVVYNGGKEVAALRGSAGEHTTNNRMELVAMLRALEWVGDQPARLHSDSQYVVRGLNSWCKAWQRRGWQRKDKATKSLQPVVNADLWQLLVAQRRACHTVLWVRGHNGTAGNERADQLAESARTGIAL